MNRIKTFSVLVLLTLAAGMLFTPTTALAQTPAPGTAAAPEPQALALFTTYPSQVIGIGLIAIAVVAVGMAVARFGRR